jgi:vacuolar-type H+-ATPase subunit I/STV1
MPNKTKTLLKLLSLEKEKLEERIQSLLTEKEVLNKKIKKIKLEKLVVDLKQEKEELDERIESLKKEKEDIRSHRKVVEIIGDLKCPKDFQCYKSKYKALCKAGVNGTLLLTLDTLYILSVSYRETPKQDV